MNTQRFSMVYEQGIAPTIIERICQILPGIQSYKQNDGPPNLATDNGLLLYLQHGEIDYQLSISPAEKLSPELLIDFSRGALGYRLRHSNSIKSDLAKAAGVKPGFRPNILDATAGLGEDGFVLASLGCKVHMLERNPLLHLILQDGIRRAAADARLAKTTQYLRLTRVDAIKFLAEFPQPPKYDTVYLDPMYPHRGKSALVKKHMRLVRQICGADEDVKELFAAALASKIGRIVLKRPSHAEFINGEAPHVQFPGKSTRFDVYINH